MRQEAEGIEQRWDQALAGFDAQIRKLEGMALPDDPKERAVFVEVMDSYRRLSKHLHAERNAGSERFGLALAGLEGELGNLRALLDRGREAAAQAKARRN